MIVEFVLPVKAFSVNKYHYANKKIKTKEARLWEDEVLYHLGKIIELKEFGTIFKKAPTSIKIKVIITYPLNVFFNSLGIISSKTFDIDNCLKPLIDLTLTKCMDINDKFVTHIEGIKVPGNSYEIYMRLEILSERV